MTNKNEVTSYCYKYKGFWIKVHIDPTDNPFRFLHTASVETPTRTAVNSPKETRDEAEVAAEELIDSWN